MPAAIKISARRVVPSKKERDNWIATVPRGAKHLAIGKPKPNAIAITQTPAATLARKNTSISEAKCGIKESADSQHDNQRHPHPPDRPQYIRGCFRAVSYHLL